MLVNIRVCVHVCMHACMHVFATHILARVFVSCYPSSIISTTSVLDLVRQFYQISLAICFGLFSSWHVCSECPTAPSVGMFIHYCILCVPFVFADVVWSVLHQFLQPVLYVPARTRNGHIWPGMVAATFACPPLVVSWFLWLRTVRVVAWHPPSAKLDLVRYICVDAVPNLCNEHLWHGFTFVLFKVLCMRDSFQILIRFQINCYMNKTISPYM